MYFFIARRLLYTVPIALGVSIICFSLIHLAPGDPLSAMLPENASPDTIADIRSAAGSGGEGVRCDAISLGVQFTGSRLRWGGLTPGPPVRNVCTDPRTDGGPGGMDGGMSGARDGGVADGG